MNSVKPNNNQPYSPMQQLKDIIAQNFEYYANSFQRQADKRMASNDLPKTNQNPFIKSPKFGDQNETQLS